MSEAGRSCNETILYPATKAYTRYGGGSEYHDSRSHSKVLKPLQVTEIISSKRYLHFLQIYIFFLNFKLFSEIKRKKTIIQYSGTC